MGEWVVVVDLAENDLRLNEKRDKSKTNEVLDSRKIRISSRFIF